MSNLKSRIKRKDSISKPIISKGGSKGHSTPHLLLASLILIFAAIGTYLILSSHAATTLNADFNSDGSVNITDLSILATNWGSTTATLAKGDANNDNKVTITDLSILAGEWGQTDTPISTAFSPRIILKQTDIDAIKTKIANHEEPQYSAWNHFLVNYANPVKDDSPDIFVGPQTITGVDTPMELKMNKDGGRARDAALGYVFNGDLDLANKSKEFLLGWARANIPTAYQDSNDKWGGSYMSHGLFMFAYAYDLTCNSSVYTDTEKSEIQSWFRSNIIALDTYLAYLKTEYVIKDNPSLIYKYEWNDNKQYYVYDSYVGGDNSSLTTIAKLALAIVVNDNVVVNDVLNNSNNVINVEKITSSSLTPRNQGDVIHTVPNPTPQVLVAKKPVWGRGGTIDYMTYNTRSMNILYELSLNYGWDSAKLSTLADNLFNTWSYLGRYFDPNKETPFINKNTIYKEDPTIIIPEDTINLDVTLDRFPLAYRDFGNRSARFLDIMSANNSINNRSSYYESQFLGPTTLTHSIIR